MTAAAGERGGGFHAVAVAAIVAAVLAFSCGSRSECRGDEDKPRGLAAAHWKLEAVELTGGRRLEGLVVDDDGDGVSFVQVVRRPGRQMFLVTWGRIAPARIRSVERLPKRERAELEKRLEAFRGRREAALAAELSVLLTRRTEDAPWAYEGPWFDLESSLDPKLTREAVVRLEQVFDAIESLVPPSRGTSPPAPDAPPAPRIRVRLCGSAADSRREQEQLGIRVGNPAFYVPSRRLLVAGSDMPAIIAEERDAADLLALEERAIADRERMFAEGVRALAADLERQGKSATQRADIITSARSRHERESAAEVARIATARRENAAQVATARRTFYAWLAHEAWHAYADVVLGGGLPLWLDEGLAQVIETAQVEVGELRLDGPDPTRLAALQDALRTGKAPPLADVLRAAPEQFHLGHAPGRSAAHDNYLAAWGLAFDLAIIEPALTPRSLAALTAAGSAADPVVRFEALVGKPVDVFEPAWRARMLALRPRTAVSPAAPDR